MKPELKIDWATHEAAKYAVENWHYSKSIPKSKLVKIGVWENQKFIGVVIFSPGATPNLGSPYGLTQRECVELSRVALTKHSTPVSRILSIALRFLVNANPKLRLVVSFADRDQSHHGVIYQATNWIYDGTGSPATFYLIHGKKNASSNDRISRTHSKFTGCEKNGQEREGDSMPRQAPLPHAA